MKLSAELENIVKELRSQGKMFFLEGATEEQLNTFESKNNVNLPTKYKQWLSFSDGGECFLPAGIQLYGVAHKPLIDVNESDRPNEDYIVIGRLATGDPILCEKGSERISIFNLEAGRIESDEIYSDFYDFLNDLSDLLGIED